MIDQWSCDCGKNHTLTERYCDNCGKSIPDHILDEIVREENRGFLLWTGRCVKNSQQKIMKRVSSIANSIIGRIVGYCFLVVLGIIALRVFKKVLVWEYNVFPYLVAFFSFFGFASYSLFLTIKSVANKTEYSLIRKRVNRFYYVAILIMAFYLLVLPSFIGIIRFGVIVISLMLFSIAFYEIYIQEKTKTSHLGNSFILSCIIKAIVVLVIYCIFK